MSWGLFVCGGDFFCVVGGVVLCMYRCVSVWRGEAERCVRGRGHRVIAQRSVVVHFRFVFTVQPTTPMSGLTLAANQTMSSMTSK